MKFWLTSLPIYLIPLSLGLGLPAVVIWRRNPLDWMDFSLYIIAMLMLVLASISFCFIGSRLLFPKYWWMGQVEGKDVFEYDGIYFLGLRLSRIPTRLQRMLFGVDDQMRNWDLVYGVMVLVMLAPHFLAFLTAHRILDERLPNPEIFPESLHQTMLSSLPVAQELGGSWSESPAFKARVEKTLQEASQVPAPNNEQRFRIAQLQMMKAFVRRTRASDPFLDSPGEVLFFSRGQGSKAVDTLQFILDQPELQRSGWSGGALALIGFFHLSDRNFAMAEEFFRQSLANWGEANESRMPLYHVLLLAAQTALLQGDEDKAIEHLETILLNDRLPNLAYALAMEHYAEAQRLKRTPEKAGELLKKAMEYYKLEQNRGGLARIHLRLAALALDEGRRKDARHELSIASSLAFGLNDGFMLNMVEKLVLAFSG